jgi:hypothetical protein
MSASPNRRTLWVVVAIALLGTLLTYLERNSTLSDNAPGLAHVLDLVLLPAFVLGALIGGNIHRPPAALVYSFLFVTYLLLCFFVSLAIRSIRSLLRQRDA